MLYFHTRKHSADREPSTSLINGHFWKVWLGDISWVALLAVSSQEVATSSRRRSGWSRSWSCPCSPAGKRAGVADGGSSTSQRKWKQIKKRTRKILRTMSMTTIWKRSPKQLSSLSWSLLDYADNYSRWVPISFFRAQFPLMMACKYHCWTHGTCVRSGSLKLFIRRFFFLHLLLQSSFISGQLRLLVALKVIF